MKKFQLTMSQNLLLCFTSMAIAIVLIILASTSITHNRAHPLKNKQLFETQYQVYSPAGLDAQINIVSATKLQAVILNGKNINVAYNYPKTRVSHQDKIFGDMYLIPLERGTNTLTVKTHKDDGQHHIQLAQKHRFPIFLITTALLLIPGTYLLIYATLPLIGFSIRHWDRRPQIPLAVMMIALGIFIRILYSLDMGYIQFQHDYHGHVEYIEFIAHEFFVPLPHKAWEFPQQPIYYLTTGGIYSLLEHLDLSKNNILKVISFITSILSCVGLIYAYRLVRLLTTDTLVHNLTMGFLCFVPSFIYMSSRINNDPWAAALACIAFFYITLSYKHHWQKYLYKALLFCSLAFLTKISALVVEAFMLVLLVTSYISSPEKMRKPLITTAFVGVPVLAYTLFRSYYPAANSLAMVNSGIWPGQDLRPIELKYLLSFNFFSLFQEAQSHIGASDNHAITRSFPTYQFSTMLFGEFDHSWWRNQSYSLFANMQALILLALAVPIGWIAFGFKQKNTIEWMFLSAIALSLLLQLHFIFSYPSVSNTDFRYHAVVFFPLAYLYASGIAYLLNKLPKIRLMSIVWGSAFSALCITYIMTLIKL